MLQRLAVQALLGRGDEIVDQLDLVVLALGEEALARLRDGHVLALERLGGLDVRAHALFDLREVGLGEGGPVGELEVVVEAVLDRRPDRDLDALVELHDRRGEHVRGVVADQLQGLRPVVFSEDRELRPVGQWAREVAHLGTRAVVGVPTDGDLDRERGAREARPDRGGGVGAGGAVGQLERVAVGECDRHGHLSRAGYPPAARLSSDACVPPGACAARVL